MINEFIIKSDFEPFGDQPNAIKEIVHGFSNGKKRQTLLGVTGSGKTFTVANVIKQLKKKTLVLAPNKTLAAQLYAEFKAFFPENAVQYFVSYYDYYRPEAYMVSSDTYIEKDASINDEIDRLRHLATKDLIERDDVIVIASVSCIYGIGDKDEYKENQITIFENEELDRDIFLKELINIQYERNDIDLKRGTFRARGNRVEIFSPSDENVLIRVEFLGDTVEVINLVDPLRGNIIKKLSKVTFYPTSHYVVGKEKMDQALKTIKEELKVTLKDLKDQDKLVEHQRLKQRTSLDLEMIEEMGFCNGIENYSRHFTGRKAGEAPPTLIDFFGDDFLIVIDESHISIPQVHGMYKGDRSRKQNLVDFGFRLPSALDNRPLKFEEFEKKLDKVLFVSATPGDYELEESQGEFIEQIIRPTGLLDPMVEIRNAEHQVDDMLVEVKKTIKDGFRVLITTLTKKLAEELTKYYQSVGIKVKYLHSDIDTIERIKILKSLRQGEFDVLVGINLLREGIDLPEVSLIGVLDADKEGYLRSTRSLIQIIGRAARNENGRVILYAYKETNSIKSAVDETRRRRIIQEEYNKKHNITPKTIQKKIMGGVMEALIQFKEDSSKKKSKKPKKTEELNIENLEYEISKLKLEMKKASKNLNFEEAIKLRDEIKRLNDLRLFL